MLCLIFVVYRPIRQHADFYPPGLNAHLYLKVGGGIVVSVKANCIDSTAAPEAVFAREVQKMKEERIKVCTSMNLAMQLRGLHHW